MRGYRRLREGKRLILLSEIMSTLTYREVQPGYLPGWFLGAAAPYSQISTRQYLLIRVMGSMAMNSAVLASVGSKKPIIYPMPAEWRRYLADHGMHVSCFRSALAWWIYVLILWVYGISCILSIIGSSLRAGTTNAWRAAGRYAYFVSLGHDNLPRQKSGGGNFDILSWYWLWQGRIQAPDYLAHSVKYADDDIMPLAKYLPTALPPLQGAAIAKFAVWGGFASFSGLMYALSGQWGQAVLLSEAAIAAGLRLQSDAPIAQEYLLHASNVVYRPLWTYEAAKLGALCTLYFYSTNSEQFKLPAGELCPPHSWPIMTWPRYLVWDSQQAAFLRENLGSQSGSVEIIEVGPIWFSSSSIAMPDIGTGAVAVFDVQPQRRSRSQTLATPHEYYAPETAQAFLRDIAEVSAAFGQPVVFKRKRRATSYIHKGYLREVDRLAETFSIKLIDPDISAFRVIQASEMVISMPFTSTALIGLAARKPSIYYDPLSFIHPNDPAARNVPIIRGPEELRIWFATTLQGFAT